MNGESRSGSGQIGSRRLQLAGALKAALVMAVVCAVVTTTVAAAQGGLEVAWYRQFGSTAFYDSSADLAVSSHGVYVGGYVTGALPEHTYAGGAFDGYVRKYDAEGNHVWTDQVGTVGYDMVTGLTTDATGLYAEGFMWPNWPQLLDPYVGFIRKYDPQGNQVWTQSIGGPGFGVQGNDIALHDTYLYVVGAVSRGTFPGQTYAGGSWDAFIVKYDTAGTCLWTRSFGTSLDDRAIGVAADDSGVYLVGRTTGGLPDQTDGGTAEAWLGGVDAFVRKYDANGNELWTRQFGTQLDDISVQVALDDCGVYVVGLTKGILPGQTGVGVEDGFIRKYDRNGDEIWTRQFGSSAGYTGTFGVTAYGSGIYVCGKTTGALPGQTSAGSWDAYIREYNPDGDEVWTYQWGTAATEGADAIGVDDSGIYVSGEVGPPSEYPYFQYDEVYVVKFQPENRPPVADAGEPYTVDEGGTVEVSASAFDPDGDDLTFAWDLDNDGAFETPGDTATFSAAGLDGPGTHAVAVQVTDPGGLTSTDHATVEVANVAPTAGSINAPLQPVPVGATVDASASFADPGTLDTHTATWDWGDGAITDGTVDESAGSGTASGTHIYAAPGVYTVGVTVADDDGATAESVYQFVVVFDPEGGFVTGAGWIDSPAGAYAADATLTGKATFGFVARYQKGANVPTGNTEFQFKAGSLHFKSTSYDWLVVAGANAKFKGVGTINGSGTYEFMLTATDGDVNGGGGVDGFRIKITGGDGGIVYDNKMTASDDAPDTTAIGGGSVVIHRP